jgi:hypothetical protein
MNDTLTPVQNDILAKGVTARGPICAQFAAAVQRRRPEAVFWNFCGQARQSLTAGHDK